MNRTEQYKKIFERVFVTAEENVEEMVYRKTEGWNSIGHMMLMTEIEEAFGIKLATQDIMDLHSYEKGKEILKKYQIEV